jgi:MYXO-CTERM domain-containing protein
MENTAASEEANGLYWGSELSVNQIAEKLDLSKGRLYEMIRPDPTGLFCPLCGAEADYPNRTAREKAKVLCPECGFEGTDMELVHPDTEYEDFGDQVAAATEDAWRPSRNVFWGAVLLGAAAGIVLVRRRKDSNES